MMLLLTILIEVIVLDIIYCVIIELGNIISFVFVDTGVPINIATLVR